jgi:hypothetical protein
MLWESCSSGYTENSKIKLAIYGFVYDFILNLQAPIKAHKKGKNHFASAPLESF